MTPERIPQSALAAEFLGLCALADLCPAFTPLSSAVQSADHTASGRVYAPVGLGNPNQGSGTHFLGKTSGASAFVTGMEIPLPHRPRAWGQNSSVSTAVAFFSL